MCRSGVPEMNEDREKLIESCMEKKISVGNTFFGKKDIHKLKWET